MSESGLLDALAHVVLKRIQTHVVFMPLAVFLGVAILSGLGAGNIAVIALVAPLALRTAQQIGLS
jgi:di/tricarboxylate transporter